MNLDIQITQVARKFLNISSPHSHQHYELLISPQDGGQLQIGDRFEPLLRGCIFVIKPGVMHHTYATVHSYQRIAIYVSEETLWSLSSPDINLINLLETTCGGPLLNDEQLEEIEDLCARYMRIKPSKLAYMEKNVLIMQIFLFIVKVLSQTETELPNHVSERYMKIIPIIDYISQNYSGKISLDALSQDFYISKSHLCRLFKETTGFSIGQYITNCRIRQACKYLLDGVSAQKTGELVGYDNNTSFTRVFKNTLGVPPGKYKASFKKKEGQSLNTQSDKQSTSISRWR